MRPRNVLTETNDMRRLMGLSLLSEDTGDSIKDIKKKVLNEDRSFSLGFGNQGGLTISEESEHDCKKTHPDQSHPEWEESNLEETTQAIEFEDEGVGENGDDIVEEYEVEYQDDKWLVLHGDEEYEEPINEIEKAQKMAEERELKAKELKAKSNKDPMEDNVMNEFDGDMGGELGGSPGIDVDADEAIGDGEGGLGEPADDQVVSEQVTNGNSFAKYNITEDRKL